MTIIKRIWNYVVIAALLVLAVIDELRESGRKEVPDDK